jgi:antitoxin ChpS
VTIENGRLVIEPTARPHYTLDELLAQCDASAEISSEDQQWLDNPPLGNELL